MKHAQKCFQTSVAHIDIVHIVHMYRPSVVLVNIYALQQAILGFSLCSTQKHYTKFSC